VIVRRNHLLKQIMLKIAGSDSDPLEIDLMPGVTAGEVLNELNLSVGWVLATSSAYVSDEEVLYDKVTDGDRLWVMSDTCAW
jgi:hypothetical protein